jgi:hypothetical protein
MSTFSVENATDDNDPDYGKVRFWLDRWSIDEKNLKSVELDFHNCNEEDFE